MPRFAANLNLLFNEVPMAERYAQAAAAGFSQVTLGVLAARALQA